MSRPLSISDPAFTQGSQEGNPGNSVATKATSSIGNITYEAAQAGSAGNNITVSHRLAPVTPAVNAELVISGMTYKAKNPGTGGNAISITHQLAPDTAATKASRVISGMTYSAKEAGVPGNSITLTHSLATPIAATNASATLGGITYTAKSSGAAGNGISVTAATGSAGIAGTATLTRSLASSGSASFSITEKTDYFGSPTTVKLSAGGFATPVSSFTEFPNSVSGGDTEFNNNALLVHGNASNGANNNVFIDSALNAFTTRTGTPTQGTFTPFSKESGTWSTYHPYRGTNINSNSFFVNGTTSTGNLGSNFTLEFWFNGLPSSSTATAVVCKTRFNTDANDNWFSGVSTSGKFYFTVYHSGNQFLTIQSTSRVDDGKWHHCAFVKQGTTYRIFVDGVIEDSQVWSQSINSNTTYNVTIGGCTNNATGGDYGRCDCFVSNLRINSTALYTSSFTPSASKLSAIAGTVLLVCQDKNLKDNSSNGYSCTVQQGTPSAYPFSPFTSSPSPSASEAGGSIVLNGNSYVSVEHLSSLNFGTNDFTIECWVYYSSNNAVNQTSPCAIFSKTPTSGTTTGYSLGLTSPSGGLYFSNTVAGTEYYIASYSGFSKGTWHHVAVSRSGTTTRLFLDGALVQSGTLGNQSVSGMTGSAYIGHLPYNYKLPWVYGNFADDFYGYISNFRVINGTALYTSSFTPPVSDLLAVSGTSLLACQGSTIKDYSNNAAVLSINGSAAVSSLTPFSTDGAVRFDGVSYLTAADSASWQFTGDFTIEAWVRPISLPMNSTLQVIAGQWQPGSATNCAFHFSLYNGKLYFAYGIGSSNIGVVGTSASLSANTWQHVAVTRSGTSIKLFVNGIQDVVTGTASGALNNSTASLTLGQAAGSYFIGDISNLRIINGTALYTAQFTPPATRLSVVPNTKLLTFQKSGFADASTDNVSLTVTGSPGSPRAVASNPFSADPDAAMGSAYFNGTTDYLTVPSTTDLDFGTGDFTIECWFYISGNSALNNSSQRTGVLYSKYPASGTTNGYALQIIGNSTTTGTTLDFTQSTNGANTSIQYVATIPQKCWNHVAVSRSGSTIRLFLNGALVASSAAWGSTVVNGTGTNNTPRIGALGYAGYADYFNGYIAGLRVVKGLSLYNSAFSPPTKAPTAVAGTVLMMNFANASHLDSTNNFAITTSGNAQISSTASKFGGTSMKFDGTNSIISIGEAADPRLRLGTRDFTLEGWIYLSSLTNNATIFASYGGTGGVARSGAYALQVLSSTGKLSLYVYPTAAVLTSTSTISTGSWYHIALSRTSGTMKLYINGIQEASTGTSYDLTSDPSHASTIGGYWQNTGALESTGYLNGYIDDFRLTLGKDRYYLSGVSRSLIGTTETVTFPSGTTVAQVLSVVGPGGTNESSRVSISSSSSGILSSTDPSPNSGVTTSGGVAQESLSVSLVGTDVSVRIPASGATASSLKNALDASPSISAIVTASNPTGNASAFAKTNLSGGTDYSAGNLSSSVSGKSISISVPTGTTNAALKTYLEGVNGIAGAGGLIDLASPSGNAPTSSGPLALSGGTDVIKGSLSSSVTGSVITINVPANTTNTDLKTHLDATSSVSNLIQLAAPDGYAPTSSGPLALQGGADEVPAQLGVSVSGDTLTVNIPANTLATDVVSTINGDISATSLVSAAATDAGIASTTGSAQLAGGQD